MFFFSIVRHWITKYTQPSLKRKKKCLYPRGENQLRKQPSVLKLRLMVMSKYLNIALSYIIKFVNLALNFCNFLYSKRAILSFDILDNFIVYTSPSLLISNSNSIFLFFLNFPWVSWKVTGIFLIGKILQFSRHLS